MQVHLRLIQNDPLLSVREKAEQVEALQRKRPYNEAVHDCYGFAVTVVQTGLSAEKARVSRGAHPMVDCAEGGGCPPLEEVRSTALTSGSIVNSPDTVIR